VTTRAPMIRNNTLRLLDIFFLNHLVDGEKNPARRARGVLRCGAGAPPAHRSDNAV
jgi:hypothetical protein